MQNMARLSEHGIRLSSMCPSFLNSNSTSHTWPFSAVAELIDNASDPGVLAKQIWIDFTKEADHLCLSFTDNGSGMTPNKLHKMLSFGFTHKGSGKASLQAIGVYGNGFKSGSMRLGRDALIFTKNGGCQTVGMLSQTYLKNIKAQAVVVPIVPFNQQTKSFVVTEDSEASLSAILQHSIVSSLEQIHVHFDSIRSKKGTKILIWNIRRAKDDKPEIDFETDPSDFRLPEIHIEELRKGLRNSGSVRAEQNIPDMYYSLRAYLSILYLKPRIQIILRGEKIQAKLVSKRLKHIELDVYKPQFSKEKVRVTFGLNPKNKEHYGIMMYHKNRLIKAYEKVGCQMKTSGQRAGVGVIGVIECNFLKPAHNKQDFEYTKEYRLTLGALGIKLNDYWKEVSEKKAREREFQAVDKESNEDKQDADEDPMWIQCEECLKWRSVPAGHYSVVPENWNCSLNPNARFRSCSSPEEEDDDKELLTPSYQKNHKKQEHPRNTRREKSFESDDRAAKHQPISRCSSEPSQPTFHSTLTPSHKATGELSNRMENTPEQDQMNTEGRTDRHTNTSSAAGNPSTVTNTQKEHLRRDTVIKDSSQITQGDMRKNNMTEAQTTNTLRLKRKSQSLVYYVDKKSRPTEQQQADSEDITQDLVPGKENKITKTLSSEKNSYSQVEILTNNILKCTHSVPSAPTLEMSSQTEDSWNRWAEMDNQEAKVKKLTELEKEAQRLRCLLGLEITKTSQSTMTGPDNSRETPEEQTETLSAIVTTDVGCQADTAESSASSSDWTQVSELHKVLVQGSRTMCGMKESEQNRPLKEWNESHSRIRFGNSEACGLEDNSMVQEKLHSLRNNVVVLLTALLPQLDLTGISLDTSDVDNILQQIIDVNSLKL
ncbi:MORC family CW-type zinc finger protein 3 [Sphaeramia orbicularis]|uniref:MORC family CW-type zinc finger protein 3-like n=1 Tax=Sphaeramia orbicularis TaxID=375764 RepID=A0A672Z402_9TELE|nr:MORC family CW-type zinc finger protein 3-like [Sphaeramia orbicularis]